MHAGGSDRSTVWHQACWGRLACRQDRAGDLFLNFTEGRLHAGSWNLEILIISSLLTPACMQAGQSLTLFTSSLLRASCMQAGCLSIDSADLMEACFCRIACACRRPGSNNVSPCGRSKILWEGPGKPSHACSVSNCGQPDAPWRVSGGNVRSAYGTRSLPYRAHPENLQKSETTTDPVW